MIKYAVLGIIQGLTEFFPVSSSAHLLIMQKLMGILGQELALAVVLHLGTSLALVMFFFKDILKALVDRKTLFFIILVTVITGIIGVSGKHFFESLFNSIRPAALALLVTGVILILTKKFMRAKRSTVNSRDALILGITQAIAIIPGISRSGITISTLLFRGLNRQASFTLSFIASIPAVFGAAILEAKEVSICLQGNLLKFSLGFIFSFITGLFSLWIFKVVMNRAKLHYFGYYCIALAILTLLFIK